MNHSLDPRILHVAQVLLKHHVSPQQAVILSLCTAHPPPTMTVLSDACGISTAAMTGSIDRLEGLGWAKRTLVEGDRRSIAITITSHGSDVIAKLNKAISTL